MPTAILWFRQDLRLADNPALCEAAAANDRLIPLYLYSAEEGVPWALGSASRWWLHHSLNALDETLKDFGSRLILRRGPSLDTLRGLIAETGASRVYWNRLYEPASMVRDSAIQSRLREQGIAVETFNSALLNEPWTIKREANQPYRVFTPYWKAVQKFGLNQLPLPAPTSLPPLPPAIWGLPLDSLPLLPEISWDQGLRGCWNVGTTAAEAALQTFLDDALSGYADNRDRPDLPGTSRLSPYLHFGEISPRQIVNAVTLHTASTSAAGIIQHAEAFSRELVWREFAHQLLYHFPHTADRPLDQRFERFAWARDYGDRLKAWQQGQTGYPLVDAGMRELWHTGWMHNRVRMVAASFLTKNLLIPWEEGARWFWDTLVDADLANNTLGWQWTAGCGADAAPYFRVFNPVLQGERFDPNGVYIRRWLPELAALPTAFIYKPWTAPEDVLEAAGVHLGVNYPRPRVDLSQSRERALATFAELKSGTEAR